MSGDVLPASRRAFGPRTETPVRPAPVPSRAGAATVLETWRREAPALVADHDRAYRTLLAGVSPLIAARRYGDAAAALQVAANHAVFWHPGRFVCPEMESLIARLGAAALPHAGTRAADSGSVLHVATEFYAVGGHSRMATHWINQDADHRHSLVLTRQHEPMPAGLAAAVEASGGSLTHLNQTAGSLLDWARRLQPLLAAAELVVLHVHSMDVVPFLALAGMKRRPPVILLNHADHLFWIGADLVDLVLSTRVSGDRLTGKRRGIPDHRRAVIPLCLEMPDLSLSRAEARRQLGIAEADVVILSVARGLKFKRVGEEEFPDPLVPLLQANPTARLLVLGPGGEVDWSRAQAAVPGRITAVPRNPNTAPYFAAADIYLDSFPFVSITSMLEAGLRGLPLVTRHPFGPDCAVMGADSPGIEPEILRADTADGVVAILQNLIDDPDLRRRCGARTAAAIAETHVGEGWRSQLAPVYARARAAHAKGPHPSVEDDAATSDLDAFVPYAYGDLVHGATASGRLLRASEFVLKSAPLGWRLRTLGELRRAGLLGGLEGGVWRNLIPEWVGTNLRRGLRKVAR